MPIVFELLPDCYFCLEYLRVCWKSLKYSILMAVETIHIVHTVFVMIKCMVTAFIVICSMLIFFGKLYSMPVCLTALK